MSTPEGWSGLFSSAFAQSRNAMVLLDSSRCQRDVNGAYLRLLGYPRAELIGRPIWEFVKGGPLATEEQWRGFLAQRRFDGDATMITADGGTARVHWGATVEVVTGHRLVLFVALTTSLAGAHFRRRAPRESDVLRPLSDREREILYLIALGHTSPEIADQLHITHNTVRTHARNAMEKTGARSRAHLVAKALGEGIALTQIRAEPRRRPPSRVRSHAARPA
jgi:PAS domain S-box-containing protein